MSTKKPIHVFIVALLILAKMWKQLKCPSTDECINKMCIFLYIKIQCIITYSIFIQWNIIMNDLE